MHEDYKEILYCYIYLYVHIITVLMSSTLLHLKCVNYINFICCVTMPSNYLITKNYVHVSANCITAGVSY